MGICFHHVKAIVCDQFSSLILCLKKGDVGKTSYPAIDSSIYGEHDRLICTASIVKVNYSWLQKHTIVTYKCKDIQCCNLQCFGCWYGALIPKVIAI